jgi:outer membrane protein assembly factor BamD (BamD/ComL family)
MNYYQVGENNFDSGNYAAAAHAYERYLKTPNPKNYDRALFHLGMARALSGGSPKELQQAQADFRNLIAKYPRSPYRQQAEFILSLQGQIDRLKSDVKDRDSKIHELTEQLRKLKEIDMQRRPTRPPEE